MVDPQRRGRAGGRSAGRGGTRVSGRNRLRAGGSVSAAREITQKGGKVVIAFAVEADIDADAIRSNTFAMEWPPKSGRMQEFPEIDRAAWFDLATAREKINPAQAAFLGKLQEVLSPNIERPKPGT